LKNILPYYSYHIQPTTNYNMDIKSELETKGYVVIKDVLAPEQIETATGLFYKWIENIENIKYLHSKIDPHGIFKHHQAGHQEHAWYLRTLPNVKQIFQEVYETEDLIVSYDGCCWITPDLYKKKRDNCWTHTDQAPINHNFECLQGFVSLTDNKNTTFMVYEGSHKLFESYFKQRECKSKTNWNRIDPECLESIRDTKRVLEIPAGAVVLWDSRTFHQNQYGSSQCENRLVQYICYLPKNHKKNTRANQNKRQKYFDTRRTTSHLPCPLRVNGLQPRTYGDKSLMIDYDILPHPDLEKYAEEIQKLI